MDKAAIFGASICVFSCPHGLYYTFINVQQPCISLYEVISHYSTVGCRRTCCQRKTRLQFPDILRTCQAGNLKMRANSESGYRSHILHWFHVTGLITDKNVNWLEVRKLRTMPGCGGGPHIFRHPAVLYRNKIALTLFFLFP